MDATITPATRSGAATRQPFTVRMSARDLINIGIFAAIYTVLVMVINMVGFAGPVAVLAGAILGTVIGGIPFMLFLTRVRHGGMVIIFGLVSSLVYTLSGGPVVLLPLTVVVAVVAEVIIWRGGYRSRVAAVLAYGVYALFSAGFLLPLFYARADYLSTPGMQMMGPEYVAAMDAFFSTPMLIGYLVLTVIAGLLGGILGGRLLRKHFDRAGLT